MFHLIAQSSQQDPTVVGTWLLAAFCIIGGGLGIAVAIKHLISPAQGKEAVSKEEFVELKKDVESLMSQRDTDKERITDIRLSMEMLHRSINKDVQDLISKLADKIDRNHKIVMSVVLSTQARMPKSRHRDEDDEEGDNHD